MMIVTYQVTIEPKNKDDTMAYFRHATFLADASYDEERPSFNLAQANAVKCLVCKNLNLHMDDFIITVEVG